MIGRQDQYRWIDNQFLWKNRIHLIINQLETQYVNKIINYIHILIMILILNHIQENDL